ncbi:hypothetical protein BGX34_002052, partial [Mortierella sp. NVP85]
MYPLVPKEAVHLLSHVPDATSVETILRAIDRHDRVYHIVIPELGGTFKPDGIQMLKEIQWTRTFTLSLLKTPDFVCDTVASIDVAFSGWRDGQLLYRRDIYANPFQPPFHLEGVDSESIMFVCNYHTNGSALDGIMAFFSQNIWTEQENEFIMKGCARYVFVPVNVKNHWSVLYLDLVDHDVSFGDPFGKPAPRGTIRSVINWIQPPANELDYREFAVV